MKACFIFETVEKAMAKGNPIERTKDLVYLTDLISKFECRVQMCCESSNCAGKGDAKHDLKTQTRVNSKD